MLEVCRYIRILLERSGVLETFSGTILFSLVGHNFCHKIVYKLKSFGDCIRLVYKYCIRIVLGSEYERTHEHFELVCCEKVSYLTY